MAVIAAAWGWLRPRTDERTSLQTIVLGDSLGLTTQGLALAVAPDGRGIAFRDGEPDGRIWLKRWDQLDPVALPGTEGGTNPAFSHDGKWLAFTVGGRVKKMPVDGGSPAVVSDSAGPVNYGVTWLDDGSIVYANPAGDQLERLQPDGTVSSLGLEDTELGGYGLLNPTPLPGSHGVLFAGCTSGCVRMALYAVGLDGEAPRKLVDDAYQGWYLPIGQLLYVRLDGYRAHGAVRSRPSRDHRRPIPVIDRVTLCAASSPGWQCPVVAPWSMSPASPMRATSRSCGRAPRGGSRPLTPVGPATSTRSHSPRMADRSPSVRGCRREGSASSSRTSTMVRSVA